METWNMALDFQARSCRDRAHWCRAMAERAGDCQARDNFIDLAQQWEGMANNIEELAVLRLKCSALLNVSTYGQARMQIN
jgi:hypothetical protein